MTLTIQLRNSIFQRIDRDYSAWFNFWQRLFNSTGIIQLEANKCFNILTIQLVKNMFHVIGRNYLTFYLIFYSTLKVTCFNCLSVASHLGKIYFLEQQNLMRQYKEFFELFKFRLYACFPSQCRTILLKHYWACNHSLIGNKDQAVASPYYTAKYILYLQ